MEARNHLASGRAACSVVEVLEPRRLLSVDVRAAGNTLRITGDEADNTVQFYEDQTAAQNKTVVVAGMETWTFEKIFSRVNVNLKGGNDLFDVALAFDLVGKKQMFNVLLGDGDDTGTLRAPSYALETPLGTLPVAGDGAGIIDSSVSFTVDGGRGDDLMSCNLQESTLDNSKVALRFTGGQGGGKDQVQFDPPTYWSGSIQNGSSMRLSTSLGDGDDNVSVRVNSEITSGSSMDLDVRAGKGNDHVLYRGGLPLLSFAVVGSTRSRLVSKVDLGDGNDSYTARIDFSSDSEGSVVSDGGVARFAVSGGGGDDTIDTSLSNGGEHSRSVDGTLEFSANGGSGADRIRFDDHWDLPAGDGAPALFDMEGKGILRTIARGGPGNDVATVRLQTMSSSEGSYDVQVDGGAGDDELTLGFQNDGVHNASRYPGVSPLLDGGGGTDTWDVDGNINDLATIKRVEIEDDALM